MNPWTDDEVIALLSEAMASHEGDVDADRAREIAFAAEPARRHWPVVLAASVAGILVCGTAVWVGAHNNDNATAPAVSGPSTSNGSTAPPLGTTAENRERAIAASQAALNAMPMPDGSVQLDGKPEGWPGGGMGIGPSDWRLGRTAWWSTPLGIDAAITFLTTNAPEGMARPAGEDVVPNGNGDGVGYTEYQVIAPADPAAYSGPTLLVQFKQIGDHTVLRLDTFLFARYAVSPEHRISGDVTAVEIDRVRPADWPGDGTVGQPPSVRLEAPADATQIDKLVDAFNSLYGSGVDIAAMSCPFPGDPAPEDTVTFFVRNDDGTTSTVVTRVGLACWGQLSVAVDGNRLDVTLDPAGWDAAVTAAAGAAQSG